MHIYVDGNSFSAECWGQAKPWQGFSRVSLEAADFFLVLHQKESLSR